MNTFFIDYHLDTRWKQYATTIARGNGKGNGRTQLSDPHGVVVDQFGQIYVADWGNDRVVRWFEGCKEGTVIAGGNGKGRKANQLNGPINLSLDSQGNIYVADYNKDRIEKFEIE